MALVRGSLIGSVALLLAACTVESSDAPCPPGSDSPGSPDAGSRARSGCVRDKDITESENWSPAACPDGYLVKKDIEVKGGGVELTIEPGTVVKFDAGAGLVVGESAALVAQGTAEKKIAFQGFQAAAGTWRGLFILSNNVKNKIAFATIEHAGYGDSRDRDAALHLGLDGKQSARLELSDVEIKSNARFGLTLQHDAKLGRFERVTLKDNVDGAVHVEAPAVAQLRGDGIVYEDNGPDNLVMIESNILVQLDEDAVWPSVSPAKYRLVGQHLQDGGVLYVNRHLTIEPGAVFEMAGTSSILVAGGSSGLKAIGTADEPIVFQGVAESSWNGITFGETTWTENRLEHVDIKNAAQAPKWQYYGTGANVQKSGVLMGYNFTTPVRLVVKNLTIAGPNNAPFDITKKAACVLVDEGGNSGTGAGGTLRIQTL